MEEDPAVTGEFTGRYTIERELGRGGAAIVYLAYDNRQERHVALKMLHKELAQAIGAKRFLREIKHSSSLQHPHLLTILDSGESRGTLYYVMPYMADGSLRTRIAKEKQLPIGEAIAITRDVGEALAYAHSHGIVHRDIKPDNVLFSGKRACLADFGIARAVDSVAADTLTSTGLVVGTPAYMSPEQASGEKTVDARSDQYSLACLLYEMVTGLPPFIGATQQSVISQRFTQPPPSMRAHRPNVPEHVERAVKRALAVVPADRFASVTAFIAALDEPGAVAAPVSAHAIRRRWFAVGAAAALVVLAVMAAEPGTNWVRGAFGTKVDTSKFVVLPFLADGDAALGRRVATGVHSALREWEGLGLAGDVEVREAVARAGGAVSSLPEALRIAAELRAGKLIWGTVNEQSGQARIVAHVYDVDRSTDLLERSITGPPDRIGDTVFRELANALLASQSLPARFDDGFGGTRSYAALQAYRRGIVALGRFDLERARAELTRAVELDGEFAVALLELARVESWLQPEARTIWHARAMRAVALQDELGRRDAIRAAALMAYSEKNYPKACDHYRELIAADTLDAHAWYGLGECLHEDDAVVVDVRRPSRFRFRSSWHEAGAAFRRALVIDAGLHAVPNFQRLAQLFPTAHNQIRSGAANPGHPDGFGARPSLASVDTLAFRPYPGPNWEQEKSLGHRKLHQRALERNRGIMLELTDTWVRTYPRSSEAHAARASVLEAEGDWDGAVASLATARRFAKGQWESLVFADAEARVRLKAEDFAGARRVADSALVSVRTVTRENWEIVARLAGLVGKPGRLADALQYFWPGYSSAGDGLHQDVSRAAGQALANAALGICDARPPAVERALADLIRIHVPPDRQGVVSGGVVGPILSFSVPCASGRQLGAIQGPTHVERAQRAYAVGDSRLAQSTLNTAAAARPDLRAADLSPQLVTREAALLLALGDTAGALERIDGTLRGLPSMRETILRYPLENAILVRMMATRAELAAATNDASGARKWSQAVAVLWSDADPALRPTVARMRSIASGIR